MNRQYSKDGLLKQYQQEATDNRNRKNNEKQTRLIEERQALENLNRALEQEKRQEQYVKMQRQNEYMEEYSKVLNKKQEERGRLKNKNDYSGTFKIGGESREIRKRNYEEVTNSLPMNPTRHETEYSHGNRYHEERHTNNSINQRGKSHGYNIINHYEEKSPVQNIPHYNNNNQGRNENQTNNRISKLEQQENKYENYHSPDDHHTYGNYINAQPKMEKDNLAQQQDHVPQENNEYDEAEFEKYYENYIKHRMNDVNQGENPHDPSKHNLAEEKPHLNEMNIPSIEKIQEAPQNLEYQQNLYNDVEKGMKNLTLANESNREYLYNRNKNRFGYGYNHITHKKDSANWNEQLNAPVKITSHFSENTKYSEQEKYKKFLDNQIKEKSILNSFRDNNSNSNNTTNRLKKKNSNLTNPYSTKNYEFGGSQLNTNPITNPVNSYQFDYNRYRQFNEQVNYPSTSRNIGSARMRDVGNNIIK